MERKKELELEARRFREGNQRYIPEKNHPGLYTYKPYLKNPRSSQDYSEKGKVMGREHDEGTDTKVERTVTVA